MTEYIIIPAARSEHLIVQRLPSETLIYDENTHKAFCLNETAALVWDHCDGKRTIEELRQAVTSKLETKIGDEIIWLAVDQLERFRLLNGRIDRAAKSTMASRRRVMKLAAFTIATLPLITSILAPTPAQAASPAVCGNGITEPPEQCDDGNTVNNDSCSNTCQLN